MARKGSSTLLSPRSSLTSGGHKEMQPRRNPFLLRELARLRDDDVTYIGRELCKNARRSREARQKGIRKLAEVMQRSVQEVTRCRISARF